MGDTLLLSDKKEIKEVPVADFLKDFSAKGEFLCFYFGAHWAPPSRLFTQNLEQRLYSQEQVNGNALNEHSVEVIFVTDDREENHFKRNFLKMPWYAIPFQDEHKKKSLTSRFSICQLPTLVVIEPKQGRIITHDGSNQI